MEGSTKVIIGISVAVVLIAVGAVVYFKVIKKPNASTDEVKSGTPKGSGGGGVGSSQAPKGKMSGSGVASFDFKKKPKAAGGGGGGG